MLYDAYFDELEKYGQEVKRKVPLPTPPVTSMPTPFQLPVPPLAAPSSSSSSAGVPSVFRPPTLSNQEGSEVFSGDLAATSELLGDPAEFIRDIEVLPTQREFHPLFFLLLPPFLDLFFPC